MEDCIQQVIP